MTNPALETSAPEAAISHLGLLAGGGAFPVLIAEAARSQSINVTAFGLKGVTSPDLEGIVDRIHWVKPGQFDLIISLFHEGGISATIMAGQIKHNSIFDLVPIDKRGRKMLSRVRNLKADSILGIVVRELEDENIRVLDSTYFLKSCMPEKGLLTPAVPPSDEVVQDIEFGIEHAKAVAGLDIGQAIAIKRRSVVAVEAMEGTDAMIERAGQLAGEGIVAVKVGKPEQDSRFDVPVLGLGTVRMLVEAKAAGLGFPGREVLFFDQEEAVALAEANGISIVAV